MQNYHLLLQPANLLAFSKILEPSLLLSLTCAQLRCYFLSQLPVRGWILLCDRWWFIHTSGAGNQLLAVWLQTAKQGGIYVYVFTIRYPISYQNNDDYDRKLN